MRSKTSSGWAEIVRLSSSTDTPHTRPSNSPQSLAGTVSLHGKLVDARGPRLSLAIAFSTLFIGYLGTKIIFDTGLGEGQERASIH